MIWRVCTGPEGSQIDSYLQGKGGFGQDILSRNMV